jgi:putative ATP-dependent endonuclease of OLD family
VSLTLEKHATAPDLPQQVALTVSVSPTDLANMRRIKDEAAEIEAGQKMTFYVSPWAETGGWDVDSFAPGDQLTYVWKDGDLVPTTDKKPVDFLQYLRLFF